MMPITSVDAQPKTDSIQSESPLPTPTTIPLSSEAKLAIDFVAKQYNIPTEELEFGSEQAVTFEMLGRNYVYVTIHHDAANQYQLFSLLVDPVTKEVEPNYNAVLAAENTAYRNKYGKFEPALYERLLTVKEDELLPVAVWASHLNENRSHEQIVEDVIERFPEAEKAFNEKGSLWLVEDTELVAQIQLYYEQLLAENAGLRLQSVVELLKSQGHAMDKFVGLPALSAKLPKKLISELGNREDISMIYLTETEESPALDIAMATDRTPTVWARGYKGSSIRIAILEHYNINSTADACLDIYKVRSSTADPTGHKSRVASVAACNDAVLRGMAYEAKIADAGEDGTESDAVIALDWATQPTPTSVANVVNWSGNFQADTVLHLTDRAMDYYIWLRDFTGVVAAGNDGGNVNSPAKGYNVIAVGNVDDKNTASWSDDEMRSSSSRTNPNTSVEKPEVSAPGTLINTVAGEESGTSFAAPQVAGLAALLMQRDVDLKTSPSAVKAIIMASAVHNIEGDRRLSGVDGAGAIDAALADQIAQTEGGTSACNSPCWWSLGTNIEPGDPSNPNVIHYVDRTFNAIRGERIRVAIAWLSNPDGPPTDTSNDFLRRNFDLNIIPPSGATTPTPSESPSNNFEIVEFVAPATGQYTIRVVRNAAGDGGAELGNMLGIAWTKQATYLPDVRNSGDWASTIYVRNDGAEPRPVKVTFLDANGGYQGEANNSNNNLASNAVYVATPPAGFSGSAVVDGSEDLSVVVEHATATEKMDYTGIGGYIGGWGATGTTLYSPSLKNNYASRTGKIYVVNVGSASTNNR